MKIEGRNILDEGFGPSNIRNEKGRFGNKENVANLSNMIRQGAGEGFAAIGAKQSAISRGAGVVAQNMGSNTLEVQRILESTNDATKEEFKKLTELMANRIGATGKAQEKALKDIAVQMEKIKIVAGEEGENISKALGFDEANKQMQGSAFSAVAKATVVDPVKDFFGYGPKNNKGFLGDKGIGKPFAVMRARRNFNAKEQAAQNLAEDSQSAALKSMGGGLDVENNSVPELLQESKVILEEIRDGQNISSGPMFGPMGFGGLFTALLPLAKLAGIAVAIASLLAVAKLIADAIPGIEMTDVINAESNALRGMDAARNPPDTNAAPDTNGVTSAIDDTTKVLSEAEFVGPSKPPSIMNRVVSAGSDLISGAKGMVGKGLDFLGSNKVSGTLTGVQVAMDLREQYNTIEEANAALEMGEITPEEHQLVVDDIRNTTTGRLSGTALGTAGAIIAGAATSVAVGGIAAPIAAAAAVGVGLYKAGEAIGDSFVTTPEEAAFDEAKEKGLYDENLFSKSTINEDLLAEETNPRILKAIIDDADLTEEDMKKVQARLFEIQNPSMDVSSLESTTQTSADSIDTMPIPTGDAVEHTTALASNTNTQAPVVNNVTNNNNNSSSSNATNVFSQPLRNDNNSWSLYSTQRVLG